MKLQKLYQSKTAKILLVILVILIGVRLALPSIIKSEANKKLSQLDGYHGHIDNVRLSLLQGAYGVDSIVFSKKDSATGEVTPFMKASSMDFSLEWKSLFKGSVVAEVELFYPEILFTKEKVEPEMVVKDSAYLKSLADLAMPLEINRFVMHHGKLQYIDPALNVDVSMKDMNATALNLKNAYDSTSTYPASIEASASVYDGNLKVSAIANPLLIEPTFKMNAELVDVDLPQLNDFFNAYAKIDVNRGKFGLFTEAEAKSGRFEGYVKPVIQDLDVLSREDRKDNIFRKSWEAVVGLVSEIFENQPKDQIATKVRLAGPLENPNSNWLMAIGYILRNAFIQALQPSIDHEINIKSEVTVSSTNKK